ncbi:MAG TPA: AsmA family protein [Alphaproteobacteria bacterium]|jgi:hypothetical protein
MRLRRILTLATVAVAAIVAGAAVFVARMDLNQYKPLIAEKAQAATGRKLQISGDIHLVASLVPSLAVDGIRFENAKFGTRPEMVKAKRLEAQVALLPLLRGRVEIRRLSLVAPDILLETDDKGHGNWQFAATQTSAAPTAAPAAAATPLDLPYLAELVIEDGLITYRDGVTGRSRKLEVGHLAARSTGRDDPLSIAFDGAYEGMPVTVDGKLGALSGLDGARPFPVDLSVSAAGADVALSGTVLHPLAPSAADLALNISGKDLSGWASFAKAALPARPYSLAAKLAFRNRRFDLADLQAKLGVSDLTGTASLDLNGARPRIAATLSAQHFDMADVIPEPEADGRPVKPRGNDRLFSADPLDLSALRQVDGNVALNAASLMVGGFDLRDMAVVLSLDDGRLLAQPFAARLADGMLTGQSDLRVPANGPANLALNLQAEKLDLKALGGAFNAGDILTGQGDLLVDLKGQGGSVRALMASLNGRANWVMGKGRVKSGYVDLLGADLLRFAASAGSHGSDATAVNCLVARFDVEKGIATSKGILFDTDRMTVKGEGTVNLGNERLALLFTPRPKETSLINLAMPWRVEGSLQSPAVSVDQGALAERAAGALLSAVNPLALLVPMVTASNGEQNPCLAALQGGAPKPAAAGPASEGGVRGFLDSLIPRR